MAAMVGVNLVVRNKFFLILTALNKLMPVESTRL
jgi:hypothetical protein